MNLVMKVKAVMFDLDGTIADSFQDIANSVNYVLEKLGKPPRSLEEVRNTVGHGLRVTLEKSLGGGDAGYLDNAMKMFRSHYWDHCVDNTALCPGVVSCLEQLKSYRKAVVTNKRKAYATRILSALGALEYFDEVFGGDDYPAMKPDARALLYACERLGVDAAQTVMVGDGLPDIGCAVAAGAVPVAVTSGIGTVEELKTAGAKYILDSLEELPELLKKV